jgi:hypothetical protein
MKLAYHEDYQNRHLGISRRTTMKQEPQHNTKGTPCNIVTNCKSGKPALYIVGGKFACIEHKDEAFKLQRKHRTKVTLPDVAGFEPEVDAAVLEIEDDAEVSRFAKLVGTEGD